MRRFPDRRTRGATIVDLLVGVGLTAVVLGTAIPNLRALTEPYTLDTASRVVAADFAVARMRAIAQNRRHRIVFNDDGRWWEVQAETAPNSFTVVGARRTLPAGADFGNVAANPTFDTRGMLAAAFSVDVAGGGRQRTVSVNVLGDTIVSHAEAVAESEPQV
jgi:Tfp pilus assembly protein FimT